jgi:uncharacterized protein (DUF1501 family)
MTMTMAFYPQTTAGLASQGTSRRSALLGLTAAFALAGTSVAFASARTDRRFIVIILRGALDGLSAVQPYGDPAFRDIRGALALGEPGTSGGVLDLGGMFGLHPAMPALHGMYKSGDALLIHAVAGHYRSRSHFEAQDYLESGADQRLTSGWLNRIAGILPVDGGHENALSVGLSAPLLLRGPAAVETWAPEHFSQPAADLYQRIMAVNERDPLLGPALTEGLRQKGVNAATLSGTDIQIKGDRSFEALAGAAGHLLGRPDGPRLAALELGGWDTHAGQNGRLHIALGQLDAGIGALKAALGDVWSKTAILAVTEFGRTAHINGTGGTDHGTAGAAFLCGGAVSGGSVLADWPGLGVGQLFENRDLAPTTDLRGVIKGVASDHLGLRRPALLKVFPGGSAAEPVAGLIRT